MSDLEFVRAEWPAPAHIHAVTSTRRGGVSSGTYAGLNLAMHVGDEQACVNTNRHRVNAALALPAAPLWLRQVHGTRLVAARRHQRDTEADAIVSTAPQQVLAILTADCVPILLCNQDGTELAAVHAGWRGLYADIITAVVNSLRSTPSELIAWMGPAISVHHYEVGTTLRARFLARDRGLANAFSERGARCYADLKMIARHQFEQCGVRDVFSTDDCTFADPARFFSYRRDGETGRIATLIWRPS